VSRRGSAAEERMIDMTGYINPSWLGCGTITERPENAADDF
jgi:hypothetical protein